MVIVKRKIFQREHVLFFMMLLLFTGCAHEGRITEISAPLEQEKNIITDDELPASSLSMADQSEDKDEFDEDFDDEDFDDEDLEDDETVFDPLSGLNRFIFDFNDKLYFWMLKPIAKGYRAVIPFAARIGVKNFFHNLGTPLRMISCIFQGKGKEAEAEFGRFLVNTTAGVLGFGNPAKKYPELNPPPEDLGQTLGKYGIGDGFYIVLPFFGPSTLRDSIGMIGGWFLSPVYYVQPQEAAIGITGYEKVNDVSFRIGDYESLKDAAMDPYDAFRDAYIQHRRSKIKK